MAPRNAAAARKSSVPPLPAHLAAGANVATVVVTSTTAVHGCALPPPGVWSLELKRFVVGMVTRTRTWDAWCKPWRHNPPPCDEPAWCALRAAAAQVLGTLRAITTDEAYEACVHAAVIATARERATANPPANPPANPLTPDVAA